MPENNLTWKDFFMLLGRMLLYSLPLVFLMDKLPGGRGGNLFSVLADAVFLAAVYPAARKAGFNPANWRGYLAGLKSQLIPAFKWFLLTAGVLWLAVQAFTLTLAPWDFHWTNLLLFWIDNSSNPANAEARIAGLLANPLLLPVHILSVCALAPVMEEFLYRRWFYSATRGFMPPAAAIALNGALFGAMHGTDFFATGICGIFFCWCYQRSGRLAGPILVHAFVNVLGTGMMFYSFLSR